VTVPALRLPLARRISWPFLPPELRAEIAARCGGEIVAEEPCELGFTPGFAAVLTCADGSRHFVKAASAKAQRGSALSYRAEIAVLKSLHPSLPVPRLRWSIDGDWVALSTSYAGGRAPSLPWLPSELEACLDALEETAALLTPTPLSTGSVAEEFAAWPSYWGWVLPREHLEEAAALAAGFAAHCAGETLVHGDVRADNLLLIDGEEGGRSLRAEVLDWTWPAEGAAWLDTVTLLALARSQGAIGVDELLVTRALTRDVPAEAIDAWLALLAGYFLKSASDQVPPAAPHLRGHQQVAGEAFWDWLSARRGWLPEEP
jgi:aminoglycoside phosphotransferase (APT) family kinase protein